MGNPIVSIIVPCYNQEKFIEETLDSVLRQTFGDWECIIVNDGSTDRSQVLIDRYCVLDNRFISIRQQNSGVITARNTGIGKAVGKYLLPLDGDDKIHCTYLEKCVSALTMNENVRVVYSRAEYFDGKVGEVALDPFSLKDLLIRNMIYCTAMHYRSDSLAVGGYDPMMGNGLEDWEYWISILKRGGVAHKINEVLFFYRQSPTTRSSSYTTLDEFHLRSSVYRKHYDLYEKNFGDPINIIREKDNFSHRLNTIRRNYLYKILKCVGLLPKV